jgi:hypothetical protein
MWEKFFPPQSGLIFVETKFHPPCSRAKIFDFGNQRGKKEEERHFLQIYSPLSWTPLSLVGELVEPCRSVEMCGKNSPNVASNYFSQVFNI